MQLEKVTSRSGHATLAGWISSNDATLFTTVLVMAIAMFLAAKLTRQVTVTADIARERDNLASNVAAKSEKLQQTTTSLDELNGRLTAAHDKQNQMEQQLAAKLDSLAALDRKLNALLTEKGQLESQRQSLLAAQNVATKEKEALTAQRAAVTNERDALTTTNNELRNRLDILSKSLSQRLDALKQVETERDRLRKQADELEAVVAKLKQQSDQLKANVTELQASAVASQQQSQAKVTKLQSTLAARDKTVEDYLAKLARATEQLQRLTAENGTLQHQLSDSELKHQAELLAEGRNNRELVGLTGNLKRVAILFDASGSMRQKTADGTDRWVEAQKIAARWLEHLNIEECVLIVFSTGVQKFPADGSLADVRGESGKARRAALLQQVRNLTPSGGTNTYEALRTAYQYPIDAILLFSDGAPSHVDTGAFDPVAAQQIYQLCRTHSQVPVHTVGLANYFDQNASSFLLSLAKHTGGTFRGE